MGGALRGLILLLLTAGSSVAAILADRLLPGGNRAERVMGWWGRAFVHLGGWPVRVEGMENLPSGGAVLVVNHQSVVDIPMLLSAFPRPVRFLAKRELGEIPLFGRRWRRRGTSSSIGTIRGTRSACSGRRGRSSAKGGWWSSSRKGPAAGTGRSGSSGRGPSTSRRSPGRRCPCLHRRRVPGGPQGGISRAAAELLVRVLPPLSTGKGAGGSKERIAAAARARILAGRGNGRTTPELEEGRK